MRLAMAQYALKIDPLENVAKILRLMHDASEQGADLIVFPELCLSPFFPQYPRKDASQYVVTLEDGGMSRICGTCRELKLAALPNVYLQHGRGRFDASVMIDANGLIQGISTMVHIAQVPCFYEQDYYTPSDTGFHVYSTPFGNVGVVVCFDRHYPESTRTCTLRGAQLIIVPTANTKAEPLDLFECEMRTAAMQNGVVIAMCNRVGKEGEMEFCGQSMVVDSNGNILVKADDSEGLFIVDIDLASIEASRKSRPYLAIRRPEMYE
jgi:predicted amidohydrolase